MIRKVLTVLSGTIVAQLIGLAVLPILTRIYGPTDFGLLQIYAATMNVLLMVVALRYELGLLTAETGSDFRALLATTLRLCFLVPAVLLLFILLEHDWIVEQVPGLGPVVWLLPPALVVAGLYQTSGFLPIRLQNYRLAATSKIMQSVSNALASVALAFTPFAWTGLVLGDLAGRVLATIGILRGASHEDVQPLAPVSLQDARQALIKHRAWPMYTLPGTMMSAISAALVPISIAHYCGLDIAGQYALVERTLFLPIGMLAFALMQVFTGDLAHSLRTDPVHAHANFRRLMRYLAPIGAIGATLGWLIAPIVMPFAFGRDWAVAGELAALAMPLAALMLMASPVSMVLMLSERRKLQLAWEIARFLATLGLVWAFGRTIDPDPRSMVTAYVAVASSAYLVFLFLADRVLASVAKEAASNGVHG